MGCFNEKSGVWEVPKGSIFDRFSVKRCPETPLDRPGSSYNAGCTENQPREPVLWQLRGHVVKLPASDSILKSGKMDPERQHASTKVHPRPGYTRGLVYPWIPVHPGPVRPLVI